MRKAFTLIELLVVIFIIGLLAALVLPAVQSTREAARRIQCTNKQKQIATGLQTYENTRGCLPGWRDYITVAPPGGQPPAGFAPGEEIAAQASWVFSILPHIEQVDLFDRLKTGQVEAGTVIPPMALLLCPSHEENIRSRATTYVVNGGTVDDFSDTDGGGNTGWNGVTTDGNVANGPFLDRCWIVADGIGDCSCGNARCRHNASVGKYRHAVAKLSDISGMDGTAYTLLTAENVQRGFWISDEIVHFYHNPDGTQAAVGWRTDPLPDKRKTVTLPDPVHTIEGSVAFCWPRFYRDNAPQVVCEIAYPNNGAAQYRGFKSASGGTVQGDPARTPYFINQNRDADPAFSTWYESARPSSRHASVIIVSFCDGNVRRINDGIAEEVFVHLMTAGAAQSDAGWRFFPKDQNGNPKNFLEGKLLNTGTIFQQ